MVRQLSYLTLSESKQNKQKVSRTVIPSSSYIGVLCILYTVK